MSENTNPCHTPNTKSTGFGLSSVLNFSHRFQIVILQKQQSPNQFYSSIQYDFRIRQDRPKVQVAKVHHSPVRAAPLSPPPSQSAFGSFSKAVVTLFGIVTTIQASSTNRAISLLLRSFDLLAPACYPNLVIRCCFQSAFHSRSPDCIRVTHTQSPEIPLTPYPPSPVLG
jgi:hypothetical protein